jgi:hypothetical protein
VPIMQIFAIQFLLYDVAAGPTADFAAKSI